MSEEPDAGKVAVEGNLPARAACDVDARDVEREDVGRAAVDQERPR